MQTAASLPKLEVHGQTDRGQQRTHNEDALGWSHHSNAEEDHTAAGKHRTYTHQVTPESERLYVIADGVGGNADGEIASSLSVQTLLETFYSLQHLSQQERLDVALQRTTHTVYQLAEARSCNAASTLVAVLVWETTTNRYCQFMNVGDSSGFLIRSATGRIETHTVAHTLNNALTQSIGDAHVIPHFSSIETLATGDWLVLCSDGLSDLVQASEIAHIVQTMSVAEATTQLIQLANQRGGHDNITVLIIRNGRPARNLKRVIGLSVFVLMAVILWLFVQPIPAQTAAMLAPNNQHNQAIIQLNPTSTLAHWEPTAVQPTTIPLHATTAAQPTRIANPAPTRATVISPATNQPNQPTRQPNPTDTIQPDQPTQQPNPTATIQPDQPTQQPNPTATNQPTVQPTVAYQPPNTATATSIASATIIPPSAIIEPTTAVIIATATQQLPTVIPATATNQAAEPPTHTAVPPPTAVQGQPIEIPPTEVPDAEGDLFK